MRRAAIALALATFCGRSGDGSVPTAVPVPDIVAHGRPPRVAACGSCHLPNGFGRPETASLAGQPAIYLEQQMADYRRGARQSGEAASAPAVTMRSIASAASDRDARAAAAYFATIPYGTWIRVIEADVVPKTRISATTALLVSGGGLEPIGARIIEVPSSGGSGFVAYVPVGSVKRGEMFVTTGGAGRTVRCGLCHGDDLKGLGPVPGIAGRSPSYQVRQLRDMRRGVRRGFGADLMKATVARLSESDMIAIAAYAAARQP